MYTWHVLEETSFVCCLYFVYVCMYVCQNRNVDVYMACVRGNIFCILYVVCTLYMYVCMYLCVGILGGWQ